MSVTHSHRPHRIATGTPLDQLIGIAPVQLRDLPLELEDKYQARATTLGELTDGVVDRLVCAFSQRSEDSFPHLICISGNCRTGSTALTNLFGVAGCPAYYQPVKTLLRQRLAGEVGDLWGLPTSGEHTFVAAKEMIGPYTLADCLFNPLECLIEAGYPLDRLHLLLLDRDPYESLSSWIDKWSERLSQSELHRNFALAAVNAQRLRDYARQCGVDVVTYVYALTRWPHDAVAALFRRLGMGDRFHPGVVDDWGIRGDLGSEHSLVVYPREPPAYQFVGLHTSQSDYSFKARRTTALTDEDRSLIEDNLLDDYYRHSIDRCCEDLSLAESTRKCLVDLPLAGE